MASVDHHVSPAGIPAPHEVLGIPAHERDPGRILAAAHRRLQALESAGGSEIAVRDTLAAMIRQALAAMLGAVAADMN